MMKKVKLLLNSLLSRGGYHISRYDKSNYTFPEDMYSHIKTNYGNLIKGEILDVGSFYGSWAQKEFSGHAHVLTLDNRVGGSSEVTGDLLNLPFNKNTFDVLFCFETMEHVKNPFVAIAEIYRTLKPGGIFIGSTPFIYELHGEEYGDYWRFTRQGWENLLGDFKDIEINQFGLELSKPHHYLVKGVKH